MKALTRIAGGGSPAASPWGIDRQYAEMVDAYRHAGVTTRMLEADPHLPYQIYARASSVMTPWGATITPPAAPAGSRVIAPDMSMITPAGGGVQCICQPLRRDPA